MLAAAAAVGSTTLAHRSAFRMLSMLRMVTHNMGGKLTWCACRRVKLSLNCLYVQELPQNCLWARACGCLTRIAGRHTSLACAHRWQARIAGRHASLANRQPMVERRRREGVIPRARRARRLDRGSIHHPGRTVMPYTPDETSGFTTHHSLTHHSLTHHSPTTTK